MMNALVLESINTKAAYHVELNEQDELLIIKILFKRTHFPSVAQQPMLIII